MSYLNLLNKLAAEADKIALRYFQTVDLKVDQKKDMSPVSQADLEIEQKIRNMVANVAPEMAIYGEEMGCPSTSSGQAVSDSGKRLIIDPIDGTRNFIAGIPIFATLLAIEAEGEVISGLVSAPALQTSWWAEKGQGAFMKSGLDPEPKKLQASRINKLNEATVFYSSIAGAETDNKPVPYLDLLQKTARQRGFGDFYQHVLVAQGAGEFALDPIVKPWDIAPLKIILEEAGGKLTSFEGKDSIYEGSALSSNGLVHEDVVKSI